MAVLRPRNRTVYFRITQEEFHQLDTMCKTTEAGRSVSELSREAIRQLILNSHGMEPVNAGEMLERLDRKVMALNDKLEQILRLLPQRGGEPDPAGSAHGRQTNPPTEEERNVTD